MKRARMQPNFATKFATKIIFCNLLSQQLNYFCNLFYSNRGSWGATSIAARALPGLRASAALPRILRWRALFHGIAYTTPRLLPTYPHPVRSLQL